MLTIIQTQSGTGVIRCHNLHLFKPYVSKLIHVAIFTLGTCEESVMNILTSFLVPEDRQRSANNCIFFFLAAV